LTLADVLHGKVEELKSGHGAVLESGHMLILGWSDKVSGLQDAPQCLAMS